MKIKFSLLFILLLFTIAATAQYVPIDSLPGTYEGEYWFRWEEDPEWTIIQDTITVTNVNSTCGIYGFTGNFYLNINGSYQTTYGYCTGSVTNWITNFYAGDSIAVIYDEVSMPPPNYHVWYARFYGRRFTSELLLGNKTDTGATGPGVYPNPANSSLTISPALKGREASIKLLNIQGVVMWKGVIIDKTVINISSFPKGIYFLKYDDGERIFVKKVIKKG